MNENEKAYWLKMQRKRCGLTQKELAGRSGVSVRAIQSYEQGTRDLTGASVAFIQALCRALNCSESDILAYPGSSHTCFSDFTDEELRNLYAAKILGKPAAGKLPEDVPKQPDGKWRARLLEEMAARFYEGV